MSVFAHHISKKVGWYQELARMYRKGKLHVVLLEFWAYSAILEINLVVHIEDKRVCPWNPNTRLPFEEVYSLKMFKSSQRCSSEFRLWKQEFGGSLVYSLEKQRPKMRGILCWIRSNELDVQHDKAMWLNLKKLVLNEKNQNKGCSAKPYVPTLKMYTHTIFSKNSHIAKNIYLIH